VQRRPDNELGKVFGKEVFQEHTLDGRDIVTLLEMLR
jgi:hypothetical protein